jgi:hypothetical protein
MSIDTRTPAEIAYDATSLYLKPIDDADTPINEIERKVIAALFPDIADIAITPDEQRAIDILLKRQPADEIEIADEIDCILADMRLAVTADDAPTMREKIEILFDASEVPSGDQIFDLVLEDRVAHYAWLRCVDWVLWRQAHGKPVKVLGDPDRTSAAIDARYDAARVLSSNLENYRAATTETDMHLLCAGDMIERWERTPEEEAEIQRSNDAIISILEECEAVFERKATHTAPLAG